MDAGKINFLKHDYIPQLKKIPTDQPPKWGKMTFQQMIEHMSDFIRLASGKVAYPEIITPKEKLPKLKEFLESDIPFRENTLNPLLPAIPPPVRNATIEEAINEIATEISFFFTVFEKNHLQITRNPIFGDLNYEQNVLLLYKHATHHLRQFT
jgi:hypothetical protein